MEKNQNVEFSCNICGKVYKYKRLSRHKGKCPGPKKRKC